MTTLSAADLALSVRFNRPPRNMPATLFAVMRNEMYFLPAFLAHYRALGVKQFVIVDDASDDGTTQYLAAQPDCCSGMSEHRYGARVSISDPRYGGLVLAPQLGLVPLGRNPASGLHEFSDLRSAADPEGRDLVLDQPFDGLFERLLNLSNADGS